MLATTTLLVPAPLMLMIGICVAVVAIVVGLMHRTGFKRPPHPGRIVAVAVFGLAALYLLIPSANALLAPSERRVVSVTRSEVLTQWPTREMRLVTLADGKQYATRYRLGKGGRYRCTVRESGPLGGWPSPSLERCERTR